MTPQSQFMIVAPLLPGREADLRALLAGLNGKPGMADPQAELLPFGRFKQLHFARLVLLDDELQVDLELLGLPRPRLPTYLALMGDCDGPARDCLADLALHAGTGLRRIFVHCQGYTNNTDLLAWMLAREHPPAARYVNYLGRSVQQIQEESALQRRLTAELARALAKPADAADTAEATEATEATKLADGQNLRRRLCAFVKGEVQAGRLTLTAAPTTPLRWRLANCLHLLAVPLLGLALLPLLLVLLPLIAFRLRQLETSDPEIFPRPDAAALHQLQDLEDYDVSNQYTALGAVKPGCFRRCLLSLLLVLVDYASRHVFKRGHLARVRSIHFARWVFLDQQTRMVFTSNYDGSHQGYMDDFINKVAWGLNLLFSNGLGWPRTRWLILGGARQEQAFKYFQRRHQIPTQVWYKAYPGLTLADLQRNQLIRQGLESTAMTDAQAQSWLRLL